MAYTGHYSSLSLFLMVAVLMAGMWHSGHAIGQGQERELISLGLNLNLGLDICRKADYPALCRSVVKNRRDPTVAMESAIRQLMFQTNRAKGVAQRSKSPAMEVCVEVYDDAYSNLENCISNLKSHDKATLNINLSAALTDYVTCDDAVAEEGLTSPVTRTNAMLNEMASNGLYLSSLIRIH